LRQTGGGTERLDNWDYGAMHNIQTRTAGWRFGVGHMRPTTAVLSTTVAECPAPRFSEAQTRVWVCTSAPPPRGQV
jgi:hypothetical protein